MPLAIKLPNGKTISTSHVAKWQSRPLESLVENKLVFLVAVHEKGATIDILMAHSRSEAKAAMQWIMAKAAEAGEKRVVVAAKDVLIAVRREARERLRATLAAEAAAQTP